MLTGPHAKLSLPALYKAASVAKMASMQPCLLSFFIFDSGSAQYFHLYFKMVAGEHDTLPTCLSDRKHDGAIQNYVLHYLGCIEISERKTAYRVNNALYRNEVVNEYRQLIKGSESEQEYRRLIEAGKANEGAWENAERNAEGKVKQWQEACDTELRRIDYLRALLAKDKEVQQLVWDLKLSRAKWEKSEWYIEGLPKVKKWRARHSTSTPGMEIGQTITEDQATTVPEHAVISSSQRSQQPTSSGHHSESSNSGGLSRKADSSSSFAKNGALRRSSMDRTYEELKAYEPDKDFNLHIIEYKDTESREGTVDGNQPVRVKRQLPDRKLKIDKILEKKGTEEDPKTHPLYRTEKPGSLIYIHLPANNMIVSALRFLQNFKPLVYYSRAISTLLTVNILVG